jgi:hypothetical protein
VTNQPGNYHRFHGRLFKNKKAKGASNPILVPELLRPPPREIWQLAASAPSPAPLHESLPSALALAQESVSPPSDASALLAQASLPSLPSSLPFAQESSPPSQESPFPESHAPAHPEQGSKESPAVGDGGSVAEGCWTTPASP